MNSEDIIKLYQDFLNNKDFPCVAARAAITRQQVKYLVVDHMACPKDDTQILDFLYQFVDYFRHTEELFHSAVIIFKQPEKITESQFEELIWQRLQALANLDARQYNYDSRVDADPSSANFSFSLKEEAFFIIGLHPDSSRLARRFNYPALVFNPHAQFEQMRDMGNYNKIQNIVRKRDIALSGSINPMLKNYGEASEVYQYSGKQYGTSWQCPLNLNHAKINSNSAA
ncbi:guanitoxin biosynthesis heme-dependent pre-guanitoxin N-hydroxylase GntA [Adhaeribacter aquaticus]|uniref:guanitoxin biosynthesis heme-dependent pre-guanitoxin N-hydroxylase GntA n=1 Tax=Adhaeribacter aquaticus TaxID=299567 RepID=UPI00040893F8|nr:guanitoxin biosynthesis heme-dependent pre-guanitoxin N-hydroxylase GntA [Adhaeribacter aquaticus]